MLWMWFVRGDLDGAVVECPPEECVAGEAGEEVPHDIDCFFDEERWVEPVECHGKFAYFEEDVDGGPGNESSFKLVGKVDPDEIEKDAGDEMDE